MAQWFTTGDPSFVPAPLPAARDGFAYVQTADALWILGGWNAGYLATTDTVYKYNIHTNSWSTETAVSFAFEAYCRGVVHNSELYFLTPDGNLHKYHTDTGVTTTIGTSGVTGYHHLAIIDGVIYVGLATPTPRQYDIGLATWSAVPGAAPFTLSHNNSAALEHQGNAFVIGGIQGANYSAKAYYYNPTLDTWVTLPDLPVGLQWHSAVIYRNAIHVLAGEGPGGANTTTYRLSDDYLSWLTPYAVMPVQRAGQAAALVFNQIVVTGGYDYVALDVIATSLMLGDGLSTIDAIGGVDYPLGVSTTISAIGDVLDGPGVSASVLAFGVLGGSQESYLFLSGDILTDEDVPEAPAPTPDGAGELGTIFPPGGGVWFESKDGEFWNYSYSHSLGSGVTGQSSRLGRAAAPYVPNHVPATEFAGSSYDWSRGAEVTASQAADSLTLRTLQETYLPELINVAALEDIDSITQGNDMPAPCALPLEAELCGIEWDLWFDAICELQGELGGGPISDLVLPTRRELAISAAAFAGVGLHITDGPGLYGLDELVDKEYRTEQKTAYEVISEMVLNTSPRFWITPGIMHVYGSLLPVGSDTVPDANLIWTNLLWEDSSVDSGSIVIEENFPTQLPEAPSLQDFLSKCDEEEGGVSTWTGNFLDHGGVYNNDPPAPELGAVHDFYLAGFGDFYEKVTPTIWARRGNIKDISGDTLGFSPQFQVSYNTYGDPGSEVSYWEVEYRELGQAEWNVLFDAYGMVSHGIAYCPRTLETMESGILAWTERSGFDSEYMEIDYLIEKRNGNIVREEKVTKKTKYGIRTFAGTIRGGYLDSAIMPTEWSTVTHEYAPCCKKALVRTREAVYAAGVNKYNAFGELVPQEPGEEGTYLVRDVVTTQTWHAEGWLKSKIETVIEFDSWLWFRIASYKNSSRDESWMPIGNGLWWNQISQSGVKYVAVWQNEEPVQATPSPSVNTYRVMTDGGPPTISCGNNPCGDEETCSEKAQREYQEALDAWVFEVGVVNAQNVNRPAQVLKQQFSVNRAVLARVGDSVLTSRGSGVITRVSWSGNSGQTGSPGETVGVEVWSQIP